MVKYHGQRRHSPAQETRQSQKNMNQVQLAQHAWDPAQAASVCGFHHLLVTPGMLCLCSGKVLPVASTSLAMEAFCFVRDLMCFSSCEVLLRTNLQILSSPCEGEEGRGSHQILEMPCRAAIAQNSIQIY